MGGVVVKLSQDVRINTDARGGGNIKREKPKRRSTRHRQKVDG